MYKISLAESFERIPNYKDWERFPVIHEKKNCLENSKFRVVGLIIITTKLVV